MKPNQLWLDLSTPDLRIWINEKLQLASAKGSSTQRVGFFREIPLFALPPASATPMGWTSFEWKDVQGKFDVEEDFWIALDAARFTILEERAEKFLPPLAQEFPLATDVCFYGGTFIPWHEGHRTCVELAPSDMPLIVCPDRSPHKPLRNHADVVGFFQSLKESIQRGSRSCHIYPGFLLRQEANPTISWVFRIKRLRPDLRVHLLMGYDSFKSLSTWTEGADLMKLITGLAVVSRLEKDEEHVADSVWPLTQNPNLKINFLGHHDFEQISSTAINTK